MTIFDFANKPVDYALPFGMKTPEEAADALDKLAASLREGKILLQRCEVYDRADAEDYTLQTIMLSFVDAGPKQGVGEL